MPEMVTLMGMPSALRRDAHNAALQCLVDCGISSLPVDAKGIAKANNIKVIKNINVDLLAEYESGAYYYDYETGKRFIVYDDKLTLEWQRFVIAHEVGRGLLKHERTFEQIKPHCEKQADAFAIRLLAPSCVLRSLNLYAADEIAAACGIPLEEAQKRADRLKVLKMRGEYPYSPLEVQVLKLFEGFSCK